MAPSNETILRTRVYKFYSEHISDGKLFTVRHFRAEGVPKSTIYRILGRYKNRLSAERKPGSGRKPKIFTKKNLRRLKQTFENNGKISQSIAARKFNCSKSYIRKTLAEKTNIKYRKKKIIPKRSSEQIRLAKTKCGRMVRKFRGKEFILDDESYFTFSNSSVAGNDGFYTSDVSGAPASLKYTKKEKFEKKVLTWVAMSPKGLSQPLIRKSGLAINGEIYLEQCIKRRLIPFINKHHSDDNYIFWPDQASSHYAKIVTSYLESENVQFVSKKDNPANVPEIRPIEDFWAYLKQKV
jgi:transposase